MGRNLVICCDGTGNAFGAPSERTNVALLAKTLCKPAPGQNDGAQVVYYDPGVGTGDDFLSQAGDNRLADRLRRLRGLAVGSGVWNNVAQAYDWLADNHRPGDRIFLFGFSRGAFTVRALSGLVHTFGLLPAAHRNLTPMLVGLYKKYGSDRQMGRDDGSNAAADVSNSFAAVPVNVHFIGVWDTVESVGALSVFGGPRIVSNRDVGKTRHVRHALAIDEGRLAFLPRLFESPWQDFTGIDDKSVRQAWFPGAHCDVGGSYDHTGLADVALYWMAEEARECGLAFIGAQDGSSLQQSAIFAQEGNPHRPNPHDRLHDELITAPVWASTNLLIYLMHLIYVLVHHLHQAAPERYKGWFGWARLPPLNPAGVVTDVRRNLIEQSVQQDWARLHPVIDWRASEPTCRYYRADCVAAPETGRRIEGPAVRVTAPAAPMGVAMPAPGLGDVNGRGLRIAYVLVAAWYVLSLTGLGSGLRGALLRALHCPDCGLVNELAQCLLLPSLWQALGLLVTLTVPLVLLRARHLRP